MASALADASATVPADAATAWLAAGALDVVLAPHAPTISDGRDEERDGPQATGHLPIPLFLVHHRAPVRHHARTVYAPLADLTHSEVPVRSVDGVDRKNAGGDPQEAPWKLESSHARHARDARCAAHSTDFAPRSAAASSPPTTPSTTTPGPLMMGGVDPRPGGHRPRRRCRRTSPRSSTSPATTIVPLAVRSGGHSGAAHSSVDDGIVIDLRDLDDIEIDVADRTRLGRRRADGRRVHRRPPPSTAWPSGSATPGRSASSGITLGGGVGYLGRKFGLTIDSLLAAEIVTADGRDPAHRRRHGPRPLLGDPRRRRQLRRRHPVPVPAP